MRKLLAAALSLSVFCSCDFLGQPSSGGGSLRVYFLVPDAAKSEFPDTDEFLLTITDSRGVIAYDGLFRACPEQLEVPEGKCTVFARSEDFEGPCFDAPQFGDRQDVVIQAGKSSKVLLSCVQTNCGVRLNIGWSFLSEYPYGELYFKSSDGELLYPYNEERYAYFSPGQISLYLKDGGEESLLFSRTLASQQMLTVNLSAADEASATSGVKTEIELDTTRNWLIDNVVVGGEGSARENAFSVTEARERAGEKDVWVYGYIVGGDLSTSRFSTQSPFKSNTNIVISARTAVEDRDFCMSVQLSKGDIRDALNLVEHPDNLGRKVWLRGDIVEKYYGIPGLQNLKEFSF